ncbi:MAG: 3-deoxy-D-manno-octulosonic acid transferase [Proteobacteria bacterium ST_bin11]|nr:MAG: 3-deoxy-D-manno-octulosonic acid transferase [Proteobacteria bacterium ST_bin11]
MRQLYTLVFCLILPWVLLRLYWRGIKAPAYRLRWRERLGVYSADSQRNVLWVHAVSVGEAEASFPLIKLLQANYPDIPILVTTTTPTGSARVRAVLADQVEHVYLPYDLPFIVERFLKHFRPRLGVIMEKEIWPNLFAACAARAIPLFVINARLSERSARSYRKIPLLLKPALACVKTIAVQTMEDSVRFIDIGAESAQLQVLGNIKFDMSIDLDTVREGLQLKQRLFAQRWVWIIASTHQGEEEVVLDIYPALKALIPQLLLLIVPRHPERFKTVKVLCEQRGLTVVMRSEQQACIEQTDVYIANSIGELKMLYAAADLAFVGGSLVPVGGHNVLEPAAIGVPVLFGPEMFNFQEIAQGLLAAEGAIQCVDSFSLREAVMHLYKDEHLRTSLVGNASQFVQKNQGATAKVAALLAQSL